MSNLHLDSRFSDAVRAELVAVGTKSSALRRRQRRRRLTAAGVLFLGAVAVTSGAAALVNAFPGSTTVTPVGATHSATHTGTGLLELGPAPEGSTRVILTVRCLTPHGSISVKSAPQVAGNEYEVATFYCDGGGRVDPEGKVHPWRMKDALMPPSGSTAITITADPGTTWAVTGQYATSSTTPWGRNARGQTFGQCNIKGCPDLIGAQATNGKLGYVLDSQFSSFQGAGYIPVYESDGVTVVGKFSIGIPESEITR